MSDSRISLRPLTSADLPLITPWFEDPDTGRFLGGPEWPAQMLPLADGTPVGYIDCGTFDRCTVYGGERPDGPIVVPSAEELQEQS